MEDEIHPSVNLVDGDSKFHAIEVLDEGQGQKHTEGVDADQMESSVLAYDQKMSY